MAISPTEAVICTDIVCFAKNFKEFVELLKSTISKIVKVLKPKTTCGKKILKNLKHTLKFFKVIGKIIRYVLKYECYIKNIMNAWQSYKEKNDGDCKDFLNKVCNSSTEIVACYFHSGMIFLILLFH